MTTIAYVLKMYPRFSETFIVNEILELEKQGVNVRVYALMLPNDGRFHAKLADVKAHVTYVPHYPQFEMERVQRDHALVRETFSHGYQQAYDYAQRHNTEATSKRFLQAGCIAAELIRNPVDAMHAHFGSSAARVANFVTMMTGTPYSFTAHAKDIYHQDVKPRSLTKKISAARYVVTVSQYNKRYLEEMIGNTPSDIRVLYNGIDLERFKPLADRPTRKRHLLAVGRLVEKKGFDVLIKACAILKADGIDFTCDIVGKGGLHDALSAQIKEQDVGDRVKLVGALPQEQVLDAYHEAEMFVLPCVIAQDGNRDGLPTVLLEAMATGLPVVTTTVTGNVEIVEDGKNGLLAPPNNAEALADAIHYLLEDNERRERIGKAARATVCEKFDVTKNVNTLAQWFREPAETKVEDAYEGELADLPLPEFETPSAQELVAQL